MTVQELINELQKVEDKTKEVWINVSTDRCWLNDFVFDEDAYGDLTISAKYVEPGN